jgi:hypothetical protein
MGLRSVKDRQGGIAVASHHLTMSTDRETIESPHGA